MQENPLQKMKRKSNGFGGSSEFDEPTFEPQGMKSDSVADVLAQADELIEGEKKKLAERLANEEKDKNMSYSITGLDRCTC